jgi:hypothetical protein
MPDIKPTVDVIQHDFGPKGYISWATVGQIGFTVVQISDRKECMCYPPESIPTVKLFWPTV